MKKKFKIQRDVLLSASAIVLIGVLGWFFIRGLGALVGYVNVAIQPLPGDGGAGLEANLEDAEALFEARGG
jgi:hypothetical protein